ncbi:MAG: nucleotidyltransferase family protein [Rhizomicrobium sp.]
MLRACGVKHAAIFGSVARGDAREDSDVDVLVEIDPEKRIGLFDYAGIGLQLTDLMGRPVDVSQAKTLKSTVKDEILREKVDAF